MTSSEGVEAGTETAHAQGPHRLLRDQHGIDVSLVDEAALSVVRGLRESGFSAYLVGGCVRDMLLGHAPKDFDVATDATPEDVQRVFRRARLVGRRFRIAHVRFGREIIEVSTFRRQFDDDEAVEEHGRRDLRDQDSARAASGMILRDNVWGSIDEDAFRRDFSVNALYYDPLDEVLLDYVGGLADLRGRRLRLIGDAKIRLREDPVRILRAIRFASKLDLAIDPEIDGSIPGAAYLISAVAPARLFDEICKLFLDGHAVRAWELMRHYALAEVVFPDHDASPHSAEFIENAMRGTDERVAQDKPVTAGFLIAVLLWDAYRERLARLSESMPLVDAREAASQEVLRDQNDIAMVPRRFAQFVRETWLLQPRLELRQGKEIERLVSHPRFRAAYDFLLLRASVGDADTETADWWTAYQAAPGEERQVLRAGLGPQNGKRRRRRRRRGPAPA